MSSSSSSCPPDPCASAWAEIEEQKRDTEARQHAAENEVVHAQHEAELAQERLAALGKIKSADDAWQAARSDIESAAKVACDEVKTCGEAVRHGVAADRACLDLAYDTYASEVESREWALTEAERDLECLTAQSGQLAKELDDLQSDFENRYGNFVGTATAARDKVVKAGETFDRERSAACTFERAYIALRDVEQACAEFGTITATCVPREMLDLLECIQAKRHQVHRRRLDLNEATRRRDVAKTFLEELTTDRFEGILELSKVCRGSSSLPTSATSGIGSPIEIGDVVIANFTHGGVKSFRPRPAVVLALSQQGAILCGLTRSSQYFDRSPRQQIAVEVLESEAGGSYIWSRKAKFVASDSIDRVIGVCDPAAGTVICNHLHPDGRWDMSEFGETVARRWAGTASSQQAP